MQLLNRVACALKLMPGTPQEFGKGRGDGGPQDLFFVLEIKIDRPVGDPSRSAISDTRD